MMKPEHIEAIRLGKERAKQRRAAYQARDKAEAVAAKKRADTLIGLQVKTVERGCTPPEAEAAVEKAVEIAAKPRTRIATKWDPPPLPTTLVRKLKHPFRAVR